MCSDLLSEDILIPHKKLLICQVLLKAVASKKSIHFFIHLIYLFKFIDLIWDGKLRLLFDWKNLTQWVKTKYFQIVL